MTDFAQRIRTHVFLQPLRSDESVKYLDLQIANSGGALGKIFEMKAVERIAAAADGSPRCLSLLADECLVVCNEIASRQQPQSRLDDDGTETTQNTIRRSCFRRRGDGSVTAIAAFAVCLERNGIR